MAYADAREIEEACSVARRVLAITRTIHSARTDTRLTTVLNRLSEYGDTQPVKNLREATR
jgi:hypothetical protein